MFLSHQNHGHIPFPILPRFIDAVYFEAKPVQLPVLDPVMYVNLDNPRDNSNVDRECPRSIESVHMLDVVLSCSNGGVGAAFAVVLLGVPRGVVAQYDLQLVVILPG